jgi:hypothetical protein
MKARNSTATRLAGVLAAAGVAALAATPLARAEVDLTGEWGQKTHEDGPERGTGPDIGDFTGLPINMANRMRGETWTSSKWEQLEHECEPHPADYAPRGPGSMRIWADMDPTSMQVLRWHTEIMWMQPHREIHMEDQPRPPAIAAHTWQGYSTGRWVADMLEVSTDHLKEGWLRRNGLQRSEKAHLKEFFIRHEEYLTLVTIVHDPVYLTEPLVRTSNWALDPGYAPIPSTCIPNIEVPHPKGWVAHILPGQNPSLHEFADKFGVPYDAVKGGAETMYPEYEQKLASMPVPKPPAAPAAKRSATK